MLVGGLRFAAREKTGLATGSGLLASLFVSTTYDGSLDDRYAFSLSNGC